MTATTLIPVVPGTLGGQKTQLVDARLLHAFLEVGRDFSNWIKGRIEEYGFEQGQDYVTVARSPIPASGNRGAAIDYLLTLDMAKELAMVERTPRGREARRYFIACERQLRQMQQALPPSRGNAPVALTRAERRAINRQAWAEAADEMSRTFQARREALTREYAEEEAQGPIYLPPGYRPDWAK
jgi:phage anti-repressor protein